MELPLSALYLAGICYFVAGLYLDAVLPREVGVTKKPFFFLESLWKGTPDEGDNQSTTSARSFDPKAPLLGWSFKESVGDNEDKDCKAERRKVAKGHYSQDCPLVVRGMIVMILDKLGFLSILSRTAQEIPSLDIFSSIKGCCGRSLASC